MNILVTSDTHFGHDSIIEHCARPFLHKEEMNEVMIEKWNKKVDPKDTVLHAGDFALRMSQTEIEDLIKRLNGRIHLIMGNHDFSKRNKSMGRARGFVEKVMYKEIKVGGMLIVLSHFPFLTWNKSHWGSIHLHGHCHGGLVHKNCPACGSDRRVRRMDVGVDPNNFEPLHIDEVMERMMKIEVLRPSRGRREEEDM